MVSEVAVNSDTVRFVLGDSVRNAIACISGVAKLLLIHVVREL